MQSKLNQVFTILTFILVFNFFILDLFKFDDLSQLFKSLVFISFFFMYFFSNHTKNKYFTFFLLFYACAEFIYLAVPILGRDLYYHSSAILFMMSFLSLLIYLLRGYKLGDMFAKYSIHLLVLFFLSAIVVYKFDVFYTTEVSVNCKFVDRLTENLYNTLLALIVVFSFMRFLHFKTKNSILLFLVCVPLVFSEFIQIMLFSEPYAILTTSATMLILLSFYFSYEYYSSDELAKSKLNS